MKKAFIIILIFYLVFHFFLPKLYFFFAGEVYIYSDLVDQNAANKALWLNIITILLTVLIIRWLPVKEYLVRPPIQSSAATELFSFSILYSVIFLIASGGFKGLINGEMSGSFLNYLNLFLNPAKLLMCALFLQKRKTNAIILILIFIIITTLAGSRSAVITTLIMILAGFSFYNFYLYKRRINRFLKYAIIISPALFVFATSLRYGFDGLDYKFIMDLIAGRVSFIELGMIPIHYYDNRGLDISLFYEKYDLIHQLKLIIDSLIPGDIFGVDVMPNNYFRSIFFGYNIEFILENYMSINITLPVYFYMMYGYLGVPITVMFLVSYFLLIYSLRKHPFIVLLLLSVLYEILIYFDWVMVFNQLFTGILTIVTLKAYRIIRDTIVISIRKRKTILEMK